MPAPILATKLFIPAGRPQLIYRHRLVEHLNAGLAARRRLTLIAAPAGFGKTTLLCDWIARSQRAAAWLSLDEDDNDPARFVLYVVAALQTLDPQLGTEARGLLETQPRPPVEMILTALINAIAQSPHSLLLVLDDYHLIEVGASHAALAFLLDHLPPQLHLALASRADPPLPLARLRARGALTELRAADLRFQPDEAASFLTQVMGLTLSAADIAALEQRTEGWIAGLQMAALSMQGRSDVAGFIQAFTGSHRYVIDYLVEEVLQRQPAEVRRFLLETAILDQLTGPLCEAVTGQTEGGERLQALERSHLFVVPLDDQRTWYRYHHLFAEVLRARLRVEQPGRAAELHRRASAWYAQQGLPVEAVRHALAAEDYEQAANLIELAWPAVSRDRQDLVLQSWVKGLPDDQLRRRPVLGIYMAGALLTGGNLPAVEARLREAERWLTGEAEGAPLVADPAELRKVPAQIAIYRAALAQARGDIGETIAQARQALDRVEPGDHLGHAGAAGFLGLALWADGSLEAAHQTFAEAVTSMRRAGNLAVALSGTVVLADMHLALGRLREADRLLAQGLQLSAAQGLPVPVATGDLLVAQSELRLEQNDLAGAALCLQHSQALGERASLSENRYRWHVARARLHAAHGEWDSAHAQLAEADRRYLPGFYPNVRPIAAWRARWWIRQGRLAEAQAWVQERGLSAAEEPSYLREFEHFTLARLRLAQAQPGQADPGLRATQGLLARLQAAAEAGGRTASLIESRLLQALAWAALGQPAQAWAPLEQALTQAEPEGYVRLFIDEGPPLAGLLQAAAKRGLAPHYVPELLAAFDAGAVPPAPRPAASAAPPLPEPLSEREREVLRLLGTELAGPEIARQLMVSLNTFHTHTKNIYGKLGVKNRQAAVIRARELGLA